MPRYTVPLMTWANIAVDVDAPEDATPEQIAELAIEQHEGTSLCHQCAGTRNNGLEIGDEWEPVLHDGVPEVTRID